jgi:hypothetical protein
MRFSIRALLALMFLAALGMLVWRTFEDAQRDEVRLVQLQTEINAIQVRLRQDQPAIHQAILHTQDEFQPFRAMRERSMEHFEFVRRKYSTMEPKGAGVLSIREIPSLQTDTKVSTIIFRLLVPEDRTIWLKFGVHKVKRSVHSYRQPDTTDDLLSDSPFRVSGPFETRLQPGDHRLTISGLPFADGSLPVVITIDDKVLLRSSFVSPDVTGASSSRISAATQVDFGPERELPSLLTAHMQLRTPPSGNAPDQTYAFSLWFSERASGFKDFPKE